MRSRRFLVDGGIYHAFARINRQEFIFKDDDIKNMFLEVLKAAKKKYNFIIYHFCIMDNHIHLMIKTLNNYSLSEIMQWILSKFAVKYNKFMGYHGHVWYDRFKSKIIRTYSQFLKVFEYISNNPVKAGMVRNAEDYFYSGITFIKNKVYEIINPPGSYFSY